MGGYCGGTGPGYVKTGCVLATVLGQSVGAKSQEVVFNGAWNAGVVGNRVNGVLPAMQQGVVLGHQMVRNKRLDIGHMVIPFGGL